MHDYSARINAITDTRSSIRIECDRLRRIAGERFVSVADTSDTEVKTLVDRYHEIKNRMERSSSALERMIRIDERQTEIRMQMKELQKDIEQKESGKGLEGTYEAVGSAAFRLFREHPLVDATYSSVFSGIAKYQDEIRRLETRIEQVQNDPSNAKAGVFGKISRGGRDILLRNRRNVKENQLPGLLQKLGRDLADTDFFDAMDDPELNEAAEPLREIQKQKAELRARIQDLSNESRNLVDEFNELSGGNRLAKAQQRREDEIAAARSELNSTLLALGSLAERLQPAELKSDLGKLAAEEERKVHFDTILKRLQAGQQAELLQEAIETNKRRKERIDEKIAELKAEKKSIDDDSSKKETEREGLIEERGDESDLFDE
jgi:chromosome segregation ATPase